jgi:uncharacterized protein YaiI (UPF0178 family)
VYASFGACWLHGYVGCAVWNLTQCWNSVTFAGKEGLCTMTVYVDADACPVREEAYKVAGRYAVQVVVVANTTMRVPTDPLVELVVRKGFGAADDYIADVIGVGDIVITADIPLAARCLASGGRVIDPRGRIITDNEIGHLLGMRNLMDNLRQSGEVTAGPPPMAAKDRSRFLSKLDEVINSIRRMLPE